MALEVQDFKEGKLSVEDFPVTADKGVTLGRGTSTQQAATQALLSGGSAEDYRNGTSKVMFPETRSEFLQKHQDIRDAIWEDSKSALTSVVTDDTLSDEQRLGTLEAVKSTGAPELFWKAGTMQRLAESTLVAPLDKDAAPAAETSRDLMVDSLSEVVEAKRRSQSAINAYKASRDKSGLDGLVDLGEVMVPFAEWIYYSRLQQDLLPEGEGKFWLGQQKRAIYDSLENMSASEIADMTQEVINYLDSNDQVVLPDGNDLVVLQTLENMVLDNDYSDFERWFDNITSILDVAGLAKLVSGGSKVVRGAGKAAPTKDGEFKVTDLETGKDLDIEVELSDEFVETSTRYTRTDVAPASPSQVIKDTNPDAAKNSHLLVLEGGDEAAEGLYGTTKLEALANDLLPEPGTQLALPNKVEMPTGPGYKEDPNIKATRRDTGNLEITDAERSTFVNKTLPSRLSDIDGMKLHENSLVVRTNDNGTFGVTARYSPENYGWRFAAEALQSAQYAFRGLGFPPEAFNLMQKVNSPSGPEWSKISLEDALKAERSGKQQEYVTSIDYDYRYRPEDLEIESVLTTKGGALASLDQMTGHLSARLGQGSVVQNLMDPSSVIHPQIVSAASVAVDKSFGLKDLYVEAFAGFTDMYKALGSNELRAKVSDYIHQANFEGIPFSKKDLYSRGFEEAQVKALEVWRKANDMMWYALNDDMGRTLRTKGYKVLVHAETDTKLIGRPNKNYKGSTLAFDPAQNRVVSMSSFDEGFKAAGGEVIELRVPIEVDGQLIDHAVSHGQPHKGFIREIYDGEKVMPYRDGYYPVMYDANYFLEKVVTLADGTTKKVVFATAKTQKEVRALKEQVMRAEGLTNKEYDEIYTFRKDKSFDFQNKFFDEGSWDVATVGNMTSQRLRGKRLEQAGSDLHKSGMSNLKDPLEAVANQIHTLSQRVYLRDFFETTKSRWMQSYASHLDLPINQNTGKVDFPTSITGVKGKSNASSKMVTAAQNNFNYIYSLENGYINGMDEAYKGALHLVADMVGKLEGADKIESFAFAAAKVSPTNLAKTAAFKLFISANLARQAVLQRAQILMLPVADAKYFTTSLLPDMIDITTARAYRAAGKTSKSKRANSLLDEIEGVGLLQAVDAHNLIRTDALRLADLTLAQKAGRKLDSPFKAMQKVGFDWAEQDVLLSAWLTFRDKAVRNGRNMKDQRVKEEVLSQARIYTLNMNKSGDMPYTHNTFGVAGQFLTHIHKSMLQGITNRSLSPRKRAELVLYSTVLFGIETSPVTAFVYSWWADGEAPGPVADALVDGALDIFLNQSLTLMTGEKQAVDWGDLAPTSAYGMGEVLMGMFSSDLTELITESPAGSLMFGNNARMNQMFKTAARYMAPQSFDIATSPEGSDYILDTNGVDVIMATLNMFSGASNAFKANYAFHMGKKMNSTGRFTDEEITKVESLMGALGFRSKDEKKTQEMYQHVFGKGKKSDQSDAELWYGEMKRHLARRGDSAKEVAIAQAVFGEAWRVFGQDRPRVAGEITQLIQKDADAGDFTVLNGLLHQMDYISEDDWYNMVRKLPDNEVRQKALDAMATRKKFMEGNE